MMTANYKGPAGSGLCGEIWNKVCDTDPEFSKQVAYGKRKFHTIDATYQLRMATSLWGPYGSAWGLKNLRWSTAETGEATPVRILEYTFFCPVAEFDGAVDMVFKANDDCHKKLLTEARSKALSYLGFSADVFLGLFDDNRYVADQQAKFGEREGLMQRALVGIKSAKTPEAVKKCLARADELLAKDVFDDDIYHQLKVAITERLSQLAKGEAK